jgi:hypothetical protein
MLRCREGSERLMQELYPSSSHWPEADVEAPLVGASTLMR